MITTPETGRALLSACGQYRYELERRWAIVPRYVLWLMLNPSTADATTDDATVRRCRGYTRDWGFTGFLVGNLYAWRATRPGELDRMVGRGVDVIGPDNARSITSMVARASLIVCAWGQFGPLHAAKFEVMQKLRPPIVPHYLRMNANREPGHPLRLPKDLRPIPWDFFTRSSSPGSGS